MRSVWITDAVRTPIGRYGGALASVRADDLAALPIRTLMARNPQLDPTAIGDVILGAANQAGEDSRNVARMALLLAGLPHHVPGITVNRLCASGLEAVAWGMRMIRSGEAELALAGGVESMSRAPFVFPKAAQAFSRKTELYDTTIGWRFVNPRMQQQYGVDSMPETAENVAAHYGINREDQDWFALHSQQKAGAAMESGRFAAEITPVGLEEEGAEAAVTQDEHPRPRTSLARLQALPAPFREGGSVTAGNASGVGDGAAALILASDEAARRYGLAPRARMVCSVAAGVEPALMGMGPVPAARKALALAGIDFADLSVIELNEAFAAQAVACLRQWGLAEDDPRVNPNGGAIALSHPLGMTGARLVLTAVEELVRTGGRYALCTLCVGVGQGSALVLERAGS